MKKILYIIVTVLALFFCVACRHEPVSDLPATDSVSAGPFTKLEDLAYDVYSSYEYRIYLEEDGEYVPFLVLAADYNGTCLLLREHVLQETTFYNTTQEYASYYGNSNADIYLNTKYYSLLSEDLKSLILDSEIEITTRDCIDTHEHATEMIKRKVFLLSANELCSSAGKYIMVEEGPQLEYFKDYERCIAYTESGEAESWMLRTAALSDGSTVFGVSVDGVIGMGGINGPNGPYENNIRPAFCLPADTPIALSQDIIDGQEVYIIMY